MGMIMLHEQVKESGITNYVGVQRLVFSGINCDFLEVELTDYDDTEIVELMRYGAPSGHARGVVETHKLSHRNHSGARFFPDDVDKYIVKERKYMAVLGPFKVNPFSSDIVLSPLNSRSKPNSEDKCILVDLSFPKRIFCQ